MRAVPLARRMAQLGPDCHQQQELLLTGAGSPGRTVFPALPPAP